MNFLTSIFSKLGSFFSPVIRKIGNAASNITKKIGESSLVKKIGDSGIIQKAAPVVIDKVSEMIQNKTKPPPQPDNDDLIDRRFQNVAAARKGFNHCRCK